MMAARLGVLLEHISDLKALGGILFLHSLALRDPGARLQSGYLAQRVQAHADSALKAIQALDESTPR